MTQRARGDEPADIGIPGDAEGSRMYRLAYDESVRKIDHQRADLDVMRARSLQFLAFTASATGFLVGAGLGQTSRSPEFKLLAFAATVVSVATIALVVLVLVGAHFRKPSRTDDDDGPREGSLKRARRWWSRSHSWEFRLSTRRLIEVWIDHDLSEAAERHFIRKLALSYSDASEANDRKLKVVRAYYYGAVLMGSLQVLLWAVVVWRFR